MGEVVPNFKHKTVEEFLSYLNEGIHPPNSSQFQLSELAIHVKLVSKLCDTIDGARENFSQQSAALQTSIAGAGQDFIKTTGESIRKVDGPKKSIDDFRKSNEKTSKVLIALTAVVGFATLVQAF